MASTASATGQSATGQSGSFAVAPKSVGVVEITQKVLLRHHRSTTFQSDNPRIMMRAERIYTPDEISTKNHLFGNRDITRAFLETRSAVPRGVAIGDKVDLGELLGLWALEGRVGQVCWPVRSHHDPQLYRVGVRVRHQVSRVGPRPERLGWAQGEREREN